MIFTKINSWKNQYNENDVTLVLNQDWGEFDDDVANVCELLTNNSNKVKKS